MDTFLTLVIAVGGIATGIGAIWAAVAARRQAQVTERQAQLTEKSVTQTERRLAEQNERARLTLEYELLTRLQDRYVSPYWLSRRREAAKYLLDNAFDGSGEIAGVSSLNTAARYVCGFYDEIGEMNSLGILRDEAMWNRFSVLGQAYWLLCKPGIEKLREEWEDPTWYELFEELSNRITEMNRERGVAPPTQEVLRQIMEDEAVIGEGSSTTTTE
jgi:hypothetical protein